ncbi:MAG: DUF4198 domain-containing protein [Acidobacteriota bacterium]
MKALLGLAILIFFSMQAFAHEYWFEADDFVLTKRQPTSIRLFVGESLKMSEERVFDPSKTRSFDLFAKAGRFDMRTMANNDAPPIMSFSSNSEGTYMLNMERDWSYISLQSDKFEDYLRDEGMAYIIQERARLNESASPGRERYSRFLKTLIQVGNDRTGNIKTRIGSKLEIVPLDNPYTKKFGASAAFQFWFDDRMLADYTVFADNKDRGKITTQKLTTDKDGKVIVRLDRKGVWQLRVVYMQRCQRNCREADWESYWGSLSFGMQ